MDGFELALPAALLRGARGGAARTLRLTARVDGTHCYANNSDTVGLGLYPIVTSQYSSTPLYQVSFRVQ
jgi:hypothetical protein